MRRFLEGTWLPTLLFALPILLSLARWWHPVPALVVALYVVVVVPFIWWTTTGRRLSAELSEGIGEGMRGGVLCGLALGLVPFVFFLIVAKANPGEGLAGFVWLLILGPLFIGAAILIPGGIAIGALTVLLQWLAKRIHLRAAGF